MSEYFLRTPRIGLRRLVPDDAQAMFELGADPTVHRYVPDAPLASRGFEVLGLPRIIDVAHVDNARSIRVLEKIGLRFERSTTVEGAPAVLWALARESWRSGQGLPTPSQP
jgi:RimJ/RimL family protein N-acetyltransferase